MLGHSSTSVCLVRTLVLNLTPGQMDISYVKQKKKKKKKKKLTEGRRKTKQWIWDSTIWGSEVCGIFLVLCIVLVKLPTVTKNADSSLCSDPDLCLATALSDLILPSDCSRPISPESLSPTTRVLLPTLRLLISSTPSLRLNWPTFLVLFHFYFQSRTFIQVHADTALCVVFMSK